MLAGASFHVLAGWLVEEGKVWSPEAANRNAARFGEVTDANVQRKLLGALAGVVAGLLAGAEPTEESPLEMPAKNLSRRMIVAGRGATPRQLERGQVFFAPRALSQRAV
jgi:hypothetical protein